MDSRRLVTCFALATAVTSSACHHSDPGLPMPSAAATCLTFTYEPPDSSGGFPTLLAIDPGTDSGRAFWLPNEADSIGVWRMFYDSGYWQSTGTNAMLLHFDNGFTTVELELAGSDSLERAVATWYSDMIGSEPPRAHATVERRPCRSAGRAT